MTDTDNGDSLSLDIMCCGVNSLWKVFLFGQELLEKYKPW